MTWTEAPAMPVNGYSPRQSGNRASRRLYLVVIWQQHFELQRARLFSQTAFPMCREHWHEFCSAPGRKFVCPDDRQLCHAHNSIANTDHHFVQCEPVARGQSCQPGACLKSSLSVLLRNLERQLLLQCIG